MKVGVVKRLVEIPYILNKQRLSDTHNYEAT